jgi:TPR repeat protein
VAAAVAAIEKEAEDYMQAAFWLTKAAEQGNMDAQLKLGKMYLEGQGVPQDDDVAVAWIRKSAEQDHEWALCQLGWMYLEGQGVPQSAEAADFFLKAAELGDFDATTTDGRCTSKAGRATG